MKNKRIKISLRTGLVPAQNPASANEVRSQKRNDERAAQTKRDKHVKVTLPSLGNWGKGADDAHSEE